MKHIKHRYDWEEHTNKKVIHFPRRIGAKKDYIKRGYLNQIWKDKEESKQMLCFSEAFPGSSPIHTMIITSIAYIFWINYNAESSAYFKNMFKKNPSHFYPLDIAGNLAEIFLILKIFQHCMLWCYLLFLSFPILSPCYPNPAWYILLNIL